jgi:hypothetical protein
LLSIKAIILNNVNTRDNLSIAMIAFNDTMGKISGYINDRDTRNIGAIKRDRGQPPGRGRGTPRPGQSFAYR